MAFAVLMQEALLEMPVPTELAQHEAFAAKLGSAGQVRRRAICCGACPARVIREACP